MAKKMGPRKAGKSKVKLMPPSFELKKGMAKGKGRKGRRGSRSRY